MKKLICAMVMAILVLSCCEKVPNTPERSINDTLKKIQFLQETFQTAEIFPLPNDSGSSVSYNFLVRTNGEIRHVYVANYDSPQSPAIRSNVVAFFTKCENQPNENK
jgi:hypothetical protein